MIFHSSLDTVSSIRVSSFLAEPSVLVQLSSPTPVNFLAPSDRLMAVSRGIQEAISASSPATEVNIRSDSLGNTILNSTRLEVRKAFKRSNKHLIISIPGQGYPTNNIANGILVGPGGPTGIIGRPYGNRYGGGFSGSFSGGFGQQAFEGQHNALGSPYGAGFGGSPYGGGALNPQFQGGFPGPLFDPNTKNLQVKKIEKSAKWIHSRHASSKKSWCRPTNP